MANNITKSPETRIANKQASVQQQQRKPMLQDFSKIPEAAKRQSAVQQRQDKSSNKINDVIQKKTNTIQQSGRIIGGAAQGAVKAALSPFILFEGVEALNEIRLDVEQYSAKAADIRSSGEYYTQSQLIDARAAGDISQEQYESTLNQWRAGGNPMDVAKQSSYVTNTDAKPFTEAAAKANISIENWTNTFVPAPQSSEAEFAARVFDTVGEAVPALVTSLATGGTAAFGTAASIAVGSANAFSTEMLEGSGNVGNALLLAGTEAISEYAGNKLFNSGVSKLSEYGKLGQLAGKTLSDVSEGVEEALSGAMYGIATGEGYTFDEAKSDFMAGYAVSNIAGKISNAITSNVSIMGEVHAANDLNIPSTDASIDTAQIASSAAPAAIEGSTVDTLALPEGQGVNKAPTAQSDTGGGSSSSELPKTFDTNKISGTSNQGDNTLAEPSRAETSVAVSDVDANVSIDFEALETLAYELQNMPEQTTLTEETITPMPEVSELTSLESLEPAALSGAQTESLSAVQADTTAQTDQQAELQDVQVNENAAIIEPAPQIATQTPTEALVSTSEDTKTNTITTQTTEDTTATQAETELSTTVPVQPNVSTEISQANVNDFPSINTILGTDTAQSQTTTVESQVNTDTKLQEELQTERQLAEETARKIWTPTQVDTLTNEQNRRKEKESTRYGAGFFRGAGSTGQVYTTDRYNTTFGTLSSY